VAFGRSFDEFETGQVFRHWPGRTITGHDITAFALMSMNQHPLHVDAEFARAAGHPSTPAPETLVFSIAVGLSVADTSGRAIANLEFERVVFDRDVYAGDTLYAESEVLDVRPSASKPDRGVVYIETRAVNQHGERVLWLRRRFLAPKRSLGPVRGT
jgi:acyl dehydratase